MPGSCSTISAQLRAVSRSPRPSIAPARPQSSRSPEIVTVAGITAAVWHALRAVSPRAPT